MASSSAVSGLQSLIVFVVMALVTLWFTNIMFRALDILYKPSVQKWIRDRPGLDFPDQNGLDPDFCPADSDKPDCQGKEEEDNTKKNLPLSFTDDEYLKQLEEELMVLRAMRGKMAPNPKKKNGFTNHVKNEEEEERGKDTSGPANTNLPPILGLDEIKRLKRKRGQNAFYDEARFRENDEQHVEAFNSGQQFESVAGKPEGVCSSDSAASLKTTEEGKESLSLVELPSSSFCNKDEIEFDKEMLSKEEEVEKKNDAFEKQDKSKRNILDDEQQEDNDEKDVESDQLNDDYIEE